MLALAASFFLAAYFLFPVLVFDKTLSFFVPAKRYARTRSEELASGAFIVLVPLFLTVFLSSHCWLVGHHPFYLSEVGEIRRTSDYQVVVMAIQSDHYLEANADKVWQAARHIEQRQFRFLFWMYGFILLECGTIILIVRKYGAWRRVGFYRWVSRPFVARVSPWHILFTAYTFDPKERREVRVDVVSSGDLFTGLLGEEHYLINPDGSLNGLLLTQTKRYKRKQLEEDRRLGVTREPDSYWKTIAGEGQFYIPAGTIANMNIRFRVSEEALKKELEAAVMKLFPGNTSHVKITFNKPTSS